MRTAVALLVDTFGTLADVPETLPPMQFLTTEQRDVFEKMFLRRVNTTQHTSMGRLFDGVASPAGLCHISDYEGHGPIDLEALLDRDHTAAEPFGYIVEQNQSGYLEIDYRPIIRGIIEAGIEGQSTADVSRRFHSTIVEIVTNVCEDLSRRHRTRQVVLSGGVFLNEFLLANVIKRLRSLGTPHSIRRRSHPMMVESR